MKTHLVILLAVWGLIAGCSGKKEEKPAPAGISEEIRHILNMDIAHIDLSGISDGTYTGSFPFGDTYMYRVSVTVDSGIITGIEVLENGTENEYAEKGLGVIPRIIDKQTPNVDAVSGATVTSKALMKCVEKALAQKKQ